VFIREPNQPIAPPLEQHRSSSIPSELFVARMRRSIDLDDQHLVATNEVGNVGPDRVLPREFPAAELAVPEMAPHKALGAGGVTTKRTGAPGFDDTQPTHELLVTFAAYRAAITSLSGASRYLERMSPKYGPIARPLTRPLPVRTV
jgi:hypothetical protein